MCLRNFRKLNNQLAVRHKRRHRDKQIQTTRKSIDNSLDFADKNINRQSTLINNMKKETNTQKISHLKRREIQAPIVSAIINGFIKELGKERTLEILSKIIEKDAIDSGRLLADKFKGNSISELSKLIREVWCDEGAMIIDVLKETENEFHFNVTKCCYVEVYKKLNVSELGKCLSCDRDFSFNDGFNPEIKLERSQTIMEGADHCDFRYFKK